MFSCVFQGVIPYGAQLISAAGLAALSICNNEIFIYPYLMGISAIIAIAGTIEKGKLINDMVIST